MIVPAATGARVSIAPTVHELLDYTADQFRRWERWFAAHPAALDLPFGSGRLASVRDVVHHIVGVERRYTDRLLGRPATPYENVPKAPIGALFAEWRGARAQLERWIAWASDADLAQRLSFTTMSAGVQEASARKIVGHVLLHGIRTWAQLATVVRQAGHPTDWPHDLLFTDALD